MLSFKYISRKRKTKASLLLSGVGELLDADRKERLNALFVCIY